jgi:TRAP-type C4-dicarboxylate transport system substrate-binding protein
MALRPLTLLAALLFALPAAAQDVTLRLHHFLPAQSTVPAQILDVWADRVEAASGGRIEIQRFPSMQLGGTPPQLIDQARDGVADIVWTVIGYTPGRFPRSEVFELPFFVDDAATASAAFWQLFDAEMRPEFPGLEVLGTWVHGPGVLHADREIATPDDLRGVKVRGPSRVVNGMLEALGGTPVGMPIPAVPEALSRGVLDAAAMPWEVTGALRIPELVTHHTEFEGAMLYTLTFVLAMNRGAYDALPPDLQAVIDAESGLAFSVFAGRTQAAADAPARAVAVDRGNEIVTVSGAALADWQAVARPIVDGWVEEMAGRGIDGQALIDEARRLMAAQDG